MLHRKIEKVIANYFENKSNKILMINGARQIGKSYIIRYLGKKIFKSYVEINFVEDSIGDKLFENVTNKEDFYFRLSMIAGNKIQDKENTLIFIDEIQQYPNFITLLKFLKQDDKFTYICSGSLLDITLFKTTSIPIGSIDIVNMYPLDFEEFLWANNFNDFSIFVIKEKYSKLETIDDKTHDILLNLFKKYLIVGGLPDSVNKYIETNNIFEIRKIQNDIYSYYGDDATKYDRDNKLKIKRIYDLIPSYLENKKKRVIVKEIDNKKGDRFSNYIDEFDYLINSGVAIDVKAVSNPKFPLIESSSKNLLKLYLNDVGILTNILYKNNVKAVLDNINSINLGTVYESVVASELKAHGYDLYYYDNKKNGEVDFLINNYDKLSIIPIEIKSGKDYTVHSAINKFILNKDYNCKNGIVFSNQRHIYQKDNIIYLPIYMIMFL